MSNVTSKTHTRYGVAMTLQDKAKNAMLKGRGSLDRAVGTIVGDEQLEAKLSNSRSEPAVSATRDSSEG
jgi:hypothetical protein